MKWKADYKDGTNLMQWEGDKENRYLDIQRENLSAFSILKDSGEVVLSVSFERPTQKLIYRKRTFYQPFNSNKHYTYVWLAGWHENINGKSIKSICYIFEDGHIEMAGAKDDIELISQEMEGGE